jgi:hypothetical protein
VATNDQIATSPFTNAHREVAGETDCSFFGRSSVLLLIGFEALSIACHYG